MDPSPSAGAIPPSSLAPPDPVPKSALPYPPIHKDAKFVVLSDWDGTITTFDSNDLTDNYGFGNEKRREMNIEILNGFLTFRDAFRLMLQSIPLSFEECGAILKRDIKLDPGFAEFYAYCKAHGVPVVIVSSGMAPWIRAVLSNLIGSKDAAEIEIISNDVKVDEETGKWEIVYRHPESGFGHDKSQAILPYRALEHPPTLFFLGDGVSDLSAAAHADVLLVKLKPNGETDLVKYCDDRGIKHVKFHDFKGALSVVRRVVEGELSVEGALALGNAE